MGRGYNRVIWGKLSQKTLPFRRVVEVVAHCLRNSKVLSLIHFEHQKITFFIFIKGLKILKLNFAKNDLRYNDKQSDEKKSQNFHKILKLILNQTY